MEAGANSKRTSVDKPTAKKRKAVSVWEHRFVWFLMLVVIGLWGFHFFRGRIDRQLRSQILTMIQEKFPGHIVRLSRAHLEEGESISLEGLSLSLPTSDGPRLVVKVQRIMANGPLELLSLLQKKIDIESVAIDGMEVAIWPLDDGSWSFQSLSVDGGDIPVLPPINLNSGLLRVESSNRDVAGLVCHDFVANIRTHVSSEESRFADLVSVNVEMRSGFFESLSARLNLSGDKKNWKVTGQLDSMTVSEGVLNRLPESLYQFVSAARGVTCNTSMQFSCVRNGVNRVDYLVVGDFAKGRLEHPKMPYLLEDLHGDYELRPGSYRLNNVTARSRGASFSMNAHMQGLPPSAPLAANVQVKGLELDSRLYDTLTPKLQELWQKLSVQGRVNATAELKYDGDKWHPDVRVQCQNISIEPDVFPYRINQLSGELRFTEDSLEGQDLVARTREQEIRGNISMQKSPEAPPGLSPWLGTIAISTAGPIPIDSKLVSALTPRGAPTTKLEKFCRSLHPSGFVSINTAVFRRTDVRSKELDRYLEISFSEGGVEYDEFRYPIFDIQGNVIVDNGHVGIHELWGRNDSARIQCNGECYVDPNGALNLGLEFNAKSVSLEEELHRAMPKEIRDLWDSLQPSGVVDQVVIKLETTQPAAPLELSVEIIEESSALNGPSKSVSLRPKMLPYLLSDISCHMSFQRGRLQIDRISGSHDSSFVLAEGVCTVTDAGDWDALVKWLPTTRLVVDQSLLKTLPNSLREPLLGLDFRGPANIEGWTRFVVDPKTRRPYAESWNVDIDVEDGKLGEGWLANGIRGTIQIAGQYFNNQPVARGLLLLDGLNIRGIPILGLNGEFAILGDQMYVGREAAQVRLEDRVTQSILMRNYELTHQKLNDRQVGFVRPASASVRPNSMAVVERGVFQSSSASATAQPTKDQFYAEDIRAKVAGGSLTMYGLGWFSNASMRLQIRLDNAELPKILSSLGSPNPEAMGRVSLAITDLTGSPFTPNTMSAKGDLVIREANIFEMPELAKLFRILSIRPSDEGVFQTADAKFRLDGDRVPIDELRLDGDLISLKGSGWMNLRQEIHLDLYTYIGRRNRIAALLGPILSRENATLLLVEVDGPADDLQYRRSLPGVETTLESIFPDRASSR